MVADRFGRNTDTPPTPMLNTAKAALIGVLILAVVLLFLTTYFTVDQYERAVVTRFGKVEYVADPGLHFKIPFVNSVHHFRTDIRSITPVERDTAGKIKGVNTYTIDNQEVDVVFTVFYRILPEQVAFVYQNAQDYRERLYSMVVDRLKAEMGKVNVAHVAEKRGGCCGTLSAPY